VVSQAIALPASATFALWYSAWAAGRASLDDARDAIIGGDAGHDVAGLPGAPAGQPLILALGGLRSAGALEAGVALPVPGDPLGVAGPSAFNTDAIDAGEAVVFDGVDLGLVPHRTGSAVTWVCQPAVARRQVPDLPEADTSLREAVLVAANTLAELDVARWQPEIADELLNLRRPADLHLPASTAQRALGVLSLATRCLCVVELAMEYDGAALTAPVVDRRRAALLPLERAARRGVVAACSPAPGR